MRSLGVIFLADIVGYSKMMAQDEPGTLEKLRNFTKEVIRPTLEKHNGNMIKSLGDGWLIEFNSASNAVNCAMEWQAISKSQGQLSLRVGIHLGDVEHEEGPPPDVYGDTVNIAARLESIAEQGDVAISTSAYLCLDQNQAQVFNNCGKQTLKNIATPVEVWSTGRLNVGSKGMDRENNGPAIAIKPFTGAGDAVATFGHGLTNDLAKYLDQKDWIDSLIQQNPSEDDYQLIGSITANTPNFDVDIVLKAPGGKTLWSGNTGGPLSQIALVSDTVADQISNAVFLEIMKVKDKYK
ncbi:adenylate/guanylate cyclase domain-containing protein [Candidatus Puniceispirillum sp.]|nr:adenylate/guanylate cyclase domain-containing protein [Candidatus Puniceispirillum sp.]